jgi:hypothetical protein
LTNIKQRGRWYIVQCKNFDLKEKITISWSRSSVYKEVFFIGVEENDTLDKEGEALRYKIGPTF